MMAEVEWLEVKFVISKRSDIQLLKYLSYAIMLKLSLISLIHSYVKDKRI